MQYRCDPADLSSEAHRLAAARADHHYRCHRKHFNGDRDDLRQTAAMAVLGLPIVDGTVEDGPLLKAVDAAVMAEVRGGLKGQQLPLVTGEDGEQHQLDAVSPELWPNTDPETQDRVQQQLDRMLTDIQRDFLVKVVLLDQHPAEVAAEFNRLHRVVGTHGSTMYTAKRVRDTVTAARQVLRDHFPQSVADRLFNPQQRPTTGTDCDKATQL